MAEANCISPLVPEWPSLRYIRGIIGGTVTDKPNEDYLAAAARARVTIDQQLQAAGWIVQHRRDLNLWAGRGVAVREFVMREGHGRADYLLFIDREPVGSIEAKPEGTTLTGVEEQSAKYVTGLPDEIPSRFEQLPFAYESTSAETRFTNMLDPEPRSRRLFRFHRPEALARWLAHATEHPAAPTLRARLRVMPPLDRRGLWPSQGEAIKNLEESLAEDRPRALIQMATGSGKTFTAACPDASRTARSCGRGRPRQRPLRGRRWRDRAAQPPRDV